MGKAIAEVAIGAAAIGAAFVVPVGGIAIAGLYLSQGAAAGALASFGASQVLTGVASALAKNQGGIAVAVTTPIAPWSYVYGTQKVGGVKIFEESNNNTGVSGSTSNDKQLHRVYCLAAHPCALGSWQLRIDGKQVLMTPSGSDYVSFSPTQLKVNIINMTRSSGVVTFQITSGVPNLDGTEIQITNVADNSYNGTWVIAQPNPADNSTFTYVCGGTDGSTSGGYMRTLYADYKDKIRVSFLTGNHTTTFSTLLNAGTTWGHNDLCLGRTLVYVQMGYDDAVFPSSIPNLSFVINGKNDILDPRTGIRGFSNNPALCIADFLSLPTSKGGFGLTIGTDIPTAQLIAAANVCDELVPLAQGGFTKRYTCDTAFLLNDSRGNILKNLLSSCAGRISYQGGTYNIVPGAWVAPTLQLNDSDIVGAIHFKPRLSIRDTANAVKGAMSSPENDYQQADIPPYMQDATHGYASDPYLAEDGGERIFLETNFPCTNSSAVAQRLAKIALLRLRNQMRLTTRFTLKAYQAVALDVIQLTHPRYTWVNKNFEVLSSKLGFEQKDNGALTPYVELDLAETDSSIYDWLVTEQLTPQGYKEPQSVGNSVCAPPENVVAYSGYGATIDGIVYPSTVITGADGRVSNTIYVRWDVPNDANVVFGGHLEVQYQLSTATVWTGLTKVSATVDHLSIGSVIDGEDYNVQVRAVNHANVPSEWVEASVNVIPVVSAVFSGAPVAHVPGKVGNPFLGQNVLTAQAISPTAAQITVDNFDSTLGVLTVSCTPSPNIITGLNTGQRYTVYYFDPNFLGGIITPIATQNQADYTGVPGAYVIGSITTPTYNQSYLPSTFTDSGTTTSTSTNRAYDLDVTTYAMVNATWWTDIGGSAQTANGNGTWSGFPNVTTTSSTMITVTAEFISGTGGSANLGVNIGGTYHSLAVFGGTFAKSVYQLTIPSGTNLSTVTVNATASMSAGTPPGGASCSLFIYEISIQ